MSIFIEALHRIENWLAKTDPNFRFYLQPGLTHEEISSIVKDLPFKLSQGGLSTISMAQWYIR